MTLTRRPGLPTSSPTLRTCRSAGWSNCCRGTGHPRRRVLRLPDLRPSPDAYPSAVLPVRSSRHTSYSAAGLILQSLHLADHRSVHAAILRTPLVKASSAHPVLSAQLWHKNAASCLAQDGKDLGFAESARVLTKISQSSSPRKSTFEAR